jgi:hypothetical protein
MKREWGNGIQIKLSTLNVNKPFVFMILKNGLKLITPIDW